MIFAFSFLSIAQANPTRGLRGTLCAGNSSSCPIVQLGLAYVNNRIGFDIGGFAPIPVGFNVGARYFLTEEDKDTRIFIGVSAGGSVNGFYDIAAIGLNTGSDFHLFQNRNIIWTPRLGIDYMNTSGLTTIKNSSLKATFSLQVSYAL